jgi:hypothetical protein
MTTTKASMNGLGRGLTALPALLLRGLLGVAGLLFMVGVMLFGLAVFGVLLVWALLRGRRPVPMRFGMHRGSGWGPFQGGPSVRRAATRPVDVVDIEAREIAEPGARRD